MRDQTERADRPLYRRQALEALNSPEQLRDAIQLTPRRSWIALLALVMLLGAIVGWGLCGRIPTTISARGMLVPAGGFRFVSAPRSGVVDAIAVAVGDDLPVGRLVARIDGREVRSATGGRVVAISAAPGGYVQSGGLLLTLQPPDPQREVVLYLPVAQTRGIRPGMAARIRSRVASGSASGDLRGVVRRVGAYPATRAEMRRALGSDEVAGFFSAQGLVDEIDIELIPDPTAPGDGRSSALDAAGARSGGLFCDVTIVTGTRAPLKLLRR